VKKRSPREVSLVEPECQERTTEVSHVHKMPRLELGTTLGGMTGLDLYVFNLCIVC
jgi:hypothetical protein